MLNELSKRVHAANAKWWIDIHTRKPLVRNKGELLMLVVSELSEALEGYRKSLMDDKLPQWAMLDVELADTYIRLLDIAGGLGIDIDQNLKLMENEPHWFIGFTPNLAECLMRVTYMLSMTYAWRDDDIMFGRGVAWSLNAVRILARELEIDLMGAFEEKMAYNATRHDHSIEGRKAVGGKAF